MQRVRSISPRGQGRGYRAWSRLCPPRGGGRGPGFQKQWLEWTCARLRSSLRCDCDRKPGGRPWSPPPPPGSRRPRPVVRRPTARRRRERARPPPAAGGGLGSAPPAPERAGELAGRRRQRDARPSARGCHRGRAARTEPGRGRPGTASRHLRAFPTRGPAPRGAAAGAEGDVCRGPPRSAGPPGAAACAPLLLLGRAGDAVVPRLAGFQLGRGQAHGVQRPRGQLLRLRGGLPHTCRSHVSGPARGVRARGRTRPRAGSLPLWPRSRARPAA